jgi:hypothetical protein
MKKIIKRELFWLVLSALLSTVIAFIVLLLIGLSTEQPQMNDVEKVLTVQLYVICWFISLLTIYIFRIVIKGIYNSIH